MTESMERSPNDWAFLFLAYRLHLCLRHRGSEAITDVGPGHRVSSPQC